MGENLLFRSMVLIAGLFFLLLISRNDVYRETILQKIKKLYENPLALSLSVFTLLSILSTIFAVDIYTAFWGTATRGEGLIATLFFFFYFLLSVLVFEKKDWFVFFKLNIIVSACVLIKQGFMLVNGVMRPGSFMGSPSFLSGYLLFSIFCSLFIFTEVRNKFWKYFSFVIFIVSIVGIFTTETRGTIAALVVGFLSVLVYMIVKGKSVFYRGISFRSIGLVLCCVLFVFSVFFISTRKYEIWQKVPGLSRIATISGKDDTTQTRLIMSKISLRAVNPVNEGVKKFLIGWGPDNFLIAYTKYFNPKQFDYEITWFDRAHNEFMDVLVMKGVLGLLAYLLVLFFYFKISLRGKEFSFSHIIFLSFGVMLSVHVFFLFHQVTTVLALYSLFGFLVSWDMLIIPKEDSELSTKDRFGLVLFFLIALCFLFFCYVKNDLISNIQMRRYESLQTIKDPHFVHEWIGSVFEPFTFAQKPIRSYFLVFAQGLDIKKDSDSLALMRIALARGDAYLEKVPDDYQFLSTLAITYTEAGKDLNNKEFLLKGEKLLRSVLAHNSQKIDLRDTLAINLFSQERYEEAFDVFEGSFTVSPTYYYFQKSENNSIYVFFLDYFIHKKDEKNFMKAVDRLKQNNDVSDAVLQIVDKSLLEFKKK